MAAVARYRGVEYELVNFTDGAEWVLRDEHGDVLVFEDSEHARVEVKCERCGRWTTSIITVDAGWVCADMGCYDPEKD